MARERRVTITLNEREIQWVERAVLDGDGESALEFLCKAVKPRMDEVLNRAGCKPAFEWGTEMDFRPSGPPVGGEGGRGE